jgi:enoyl-CoA hydratase/carnithine racemase
VSFTTLEVFTRGPVGWLVFDRPQVGNAMDAAMMAELPRAWRQLDDDPAVAVIVNTGNGRFFQTGVDVRQLAGDREALREQSRRTRDADLTMSAWHNHVAKPVVAAVNGTCAGGGFHFVVDADIVICGADARFLDPHVSIGQVSGFETVGLVKKKVAATAVAELVLGGRHVRLDAARAYQLGLVSQVVDPPEGLRDAAQALAEGIAGNDPAAMAETKRALWEALERP